MEDFETKDDQIMYLLGQTLTEVKGINKRLDTLNGSVSRHEDAIDDLEKSRAAFQGERAIKDKFSTLASGAISGVIVYAVAFFAG